MSATGELLPNLGVRKFQLSDVPDMDDFNGQLDAIDSQITGTAAEQIADRIYPGVDLSVVFAQEIAGYSDVWAWIKARIQAVDYSGIHVGDYIPFTAGGNAIKAEIAGIDTYYNYGDAAVGHHIDFISRDCWPDTHQWNKANYNNGISTAMNPWLCSDIYAWLNSLSMSVPNAATANPATVSVNYTTTGVYDKLPSALKAAIVEKWVRLPRRYESGKLLLADNSWDWKSVGNLWLLSEVETYYGMEHWGSKNGFSGGGYVPYPIFSQSGRRIKGSGDGGGRSGWWLSSACGGDSSQCAFVYSNGSANYDNASASNYRAPLCFRIA